MVIDYGEKRVGIAISDPLRITAQPKPFISNNTYILESIKTFIKEYDVEEIYIGLPKHTKGGLSKKAEEVMGFTEKLEVYCEIKVKYLDERYSTVAATKQLDALGLNRKKQRKLIDSQAAAFLLQGILDKEN